MDSISLALKFFIPSWRFFDQAGPFFFLDVQEEIAEAGSGTEASNWQSFLSPPRIRFQNLFLNPVGNLYLAQINLVERFAIELGQCENIFEASVFSELVEMIQRNRQIKKRPTSHLPRFRFQIRRLQSAPAKEDIVFLSEYLGESSDHGK